MGEFGVIELLNEMIVEQRAQADSDGAPGFRLLVDTGDDAAAWKVGDTTELFTTDTMVEGVHFTRGYDAVAGLGMEGAGGEHKRHSGHGGTAQVRISNSWTAPGD